MKTKLAIAFIIATLILGVIILILHAQDQAITIMQLESRIDVLQARTDRIAANVKQQQLLQEWIVLSDILCYKQEVK